MRTESERKRSFGDERIDWADDLIRVLAGVNWLRGQGYPIPRHEPLMVIPGALVVVGERLLPAADPHSSGLDDDGGTGRRLERMRSQEVINRSDHQGRVLIL